MIHERPGIAKEPIRRPPSQLHLPTQFGSIRGTRARYVPFGESAQSSAAHLLIAEDDREMRRFLVESFRESGYRVTEAASGGELRRILFGGRPDGSTFPDILVSDVYLPDLTGLELLADLRKSDWSFPVILITAFGDDAVHREGRRLGAALVLDKPFDVEELVTAVDRLAAPR